ncbi:MAG: ABC transporter [Spirulina sp. DLM2.Bin59]|nr:MAG: ABC transporter [Spirulina sp. DLM2.Bin59]
MKIPSVLKLNLWQGVLWFGLVAVTAGIVILGMGQVASVPGIGVLTVGLLLIGIALGLRSGLWQRVAQQRSTQVNTNALIATLAVLAILTSINILAVRSSTRLDLTETQLFTLSPQTEAIVSSLENPLKVWIFEPVPNPIDQTLLNNYSRLSRYFRYEYADPQFDVAIANRFNMERIGEVHLEYEGRTQLIQTLREGSSLSEVQITNGIEKIRRDRPSIIYFLQGHGELPLEPVEGGLYEAVNHLREKGYQVETLDITAVGQVPPETTVLIIASPSRALFGGEIRAINRYLAAGGSALMLFDPETSSGLESLLAEWGVTLDGRLVIDASGAGDAVNLGPATPIVTNYGSHPITASFQNNISFYPLAQAIMLDPPEDVTATPLAITNTESWAEQNVASENLEFNPEVDEPGPLNLGVALSRPADPDLVVQRLMAIASEPEPFRLNPLTSEVDPNAPEEAPEEPATIPELEPNPESRLVVFGNATFASNGWFGQQLNGDMFLNAVKWLADEDEGLLAIRPKNLENRRIYLSLEQATLLGWLAIVIFPGLAFMAAAVIWWQRR